LQCEKRNIKNSIGLHQCGTKIIAWRHPDRFLATFGQKSSLKYNATKRAAELKTAKAHNGVQTDFCLIFDKNLV